MLARFGNNREQRQLITELDKLRIGVARSLWDEFSLLVFCFFASGF